MRYGNLPGRLKLRKDMYLLLNDSDEPECYEKALQVEAKDKWELAMDDEIASLMENQT